MNGLTPKRFDDIYRSGTKVPGRFCRVYSLPGEGKAGFATAKKIGCHARRNRQRRRLREAFRSVIADQGQLRLDVVISGSPQIQSVSFEDLKRDLATALEETRERWAGNSASS